MTAKKDDKTEKKSLTKTDAQKMCICKSCPSYAECGDQIAYCIGKKSKCIKNEKGCICMICPVQQKMDFDKTYYCIRGDYKSQKK